MLFNVFNGKLVARLVAENAFMLCTVVHINALHIGNKGGKPDVKNKDNHLKNALDDIAPYVFDGTVKIGDIIKNKTAQKRGKKDEKSYGKCQSEQKRDYGNNAYKPFSAVLFKPFVKLGGGFLVGFVKTEHIRACGYGGEGHHHRFDKINYASDKGPLKYFAFIGNRFIALSGNRYFFVIQSAYGNCGMLLASHHNAFDDRLTAYRAATCGNTAADVFGCFFSFTHFILT
jgi:hypothetical protein